MTQNSLESIYTQKDILDILSLAFTQTISGYAHMPITAQPATLGSSLAKKDLHAVGVISYQGKNFGLDLLLGFSKSALFFLYQNVFQEEVNQESPEANDLAGELLNIAFGTIDPYFSKKGIKLRSSFPIVLAGDKIISLEKVLPPKSIVMPLVASNETFFLEIFPMNTIKQSWSFTP